MSDTVAIKKQDYKPHFTDMEKLGQGASGIVYSAKDKRTGRQVALKIAPISELKELENEIGLQAMTKHPNIVECIEAYANKTSVCIVMELMTGGSLTDLLDVRSPMPENVIAGVCKGMLMALAYMHRQFRLHRWV